MQSTRADFLWLVPICYNCTYICNPPTQPIFPPVIDIKTCFQYLLIRTVILSWLLFLIYYVSKRSLLSRGSAARFTTVTKTAIVSIWWQARVLTTFDENDWYLIWYRYVIGGELLYSIRSVSRSMHNLYLFKPVQMICKLRFKKPGHTHGMSQETVFFSSNK